MNKSTPLNELGVVGPGTEAYDKQVTGYRDDKILVKEAVLVIEGRQHLVVIKGLVIEVGRQELYHIGHDTPITGNGTANHLSLQVVLEGITELHLVK